MSLSRAVLNQYIANERITQVDQLVFAEVDSERKLEMIVNAGKAGRQKFINLSQWGSLGEHSKAMMPYANEDIVYCGIQLVANHCTIKDLGLATQKANLVVHSWSVTGALSQFANEHFPNKGFVLEDRAPRGINLFSLRKAILIQCGGKEDATLADLKDIENTTFVIHTTGQFHWSTMVYNKSENELTFFDSMFDMHKNVAIRLSCLLKSAGIVPRNTSVSQLETPCIQNGGWECGYAVIVFAAHVGGTLDGVMPDEILTDDTKLTAFINRILIQEKINRETEAFFQHNCHWYKKI